MQLRLRLKLKTDYHVGAGHGLGSRIDSALLRDSDGVPVLRGTTPEGLLRDGLWRLLQTPVMARHFVSHAHAVQRRTARTDDEGTAEVLAYCMDDSQCPLCRIFGTPMRPKRWRVCSARPVGMEVPGRAAAWHAGGTGAQTATRVRVNPRTRRADDGKLFSQEEGDRRLEFDLTLTCQDDGPAVEAEAALLVAAARMVRRLGSSRRRGRGECECSAVTEEGQDETDVWLDRFQEFWLAGSPPPADAPAPPSVAGRAEASGEPRGGAGGSSALAAESRRSLGTSATAPIASAGPVCRRLVIRADEPVVIARRAEAGNMYDGLDYIHGTTLWGALAACVADQWQLRERAADFYRHGPAYAAFCDLWLRGAVRVSPLYPAEVQMGHTLYPTVVAPRDILTCKTFPGFARDQSDPRHHDAYRSAALATADGPAVCPRCAAEGQPDVPLIAATGFRPLRDFVEDASQEFRAAQRDELHPRVHPRTQRVAQGDLYGYVALESGQYFHGVLWCRDEPTWALLRSLLGCQPEGDSQREQFTLRLGKALRRGYGRVTAWVEPIRDTEPDPWRGEPLTGDGRCRVPLPPDANALTLTMTLLTDAILLDPWGRFRQTLSDRRWLQELLELENLAAGEELFAREPTAACLAAPVDGFNAQLGLPRWRDVALKAGSAVTFVLRLPAAPNRAAWIAKLLERLTQIERDGIGLRRGEGFGVVAFNHPVYQGGRSLSGTAYHLTDGLRLPKHQSVLSDEAERLTQWRHALGDAAQFNPATFCGGSALSEKNWTAVARWLGTAANAPIARLKAELSEFGKSEVLTRVRRDKDNWFNKKEGSDGIRKLQDWLRKVAELPAAIQPAAIRLLAERLSAAVKGD